MSGDIKSSKIIELIDLTKDENIKEEPIINNQCQLSTCQYTFRILIKNEVSLLHPISLSIFFHRKMKKKCSQSYPKRK